MILAQEWHKTAKSSPCSPLQDRTYVPCNFSVLFLLTPTYLTSDKWPIFQLQNDICQPQPEALIQNVTCEIFHDFCPLHSLLKYKVGSMRLLSCFHAVNLPWLPTFFSNMLFFMLIEHSSYFSFQRRDHCWLTIRLLQDRSIVGTDSALNKVKRPEELSEGRPQSGIKST